MVLIQGLLADLIANREHLKAEEMPRAEPC